MRGNRYNIVISVVDYYASAGNCLLSYRQRADELITTHYYASYENVDKSPFSIRQVIAGAGFCPR